MMSPASSTDRQSDARSQPNRQHILVVEDEEHLAVMLKFNLEAEGFRVSTVNEGPAALRLIDEAPNDVDLLVLDLMLPGMSGYAVCEAIRAAERDMPILILSARTLSEDRTRGFEVGANQYMMKPFELDEFISRVKNLLAHNRRNDPQPQLARAEPFEFGGASINWDTFEVVVHGETVRMTQKELRLLRYFVENPGRVIPRSELLENVWEQPGHLNTRAPDQFIRRLRKAFEVDPAQPRHFLTIRDAGYRFVADPDEA